MDKLRNYIWLAGMASIVVVQPGWADVGAGEEGEGRAAQAQALTNVPQLNEIEQAATTVDEWLIQIAQTSTIEVTDVQLNPRDAGLEVILITADGQLPIPAAAIVGNAVIADIANAVLVLPDGDEFLASEPAAGIALISVTNLPGNLANSHKLLPHYCLSMWEPTNGRSRYKRSLKCWDALSRQTL